MARRRAREFALQALFQVDMTGCTATDALASLWVGLVEGEGIGGIKPAESDEVEFAEALVLGVLGRGAELDAHIESASQNWRLSRMPVVDRNILRLSAYELLTATDVPGSVCINEAIELAKRFGDKDSKAFVNGILDRIAADVGRGGRKNPPRPSAAG